MILIVNTTSDLSVTDKLRNLTDSKGIDAQFIECKELKINPCIGCNHCWLKTPGICSIKDDYEKILKAFLKADQMWVISDTALGGVDHKGKNVIDRIIPAATMYLKFEGDQMRHYRRYDSVTDFGLIVTGEGDMEFLKLWNQRVAVNFGSKSIGVFKAGREEEAVACMY